MLNFFLIYIIRSVYYGLVVNQQNMVVGEDRSKEKEGEGELSDEHELKNTLNGVFHNYNELRIDKELNFKKEDFIVFLVVDGYE